MSVFHNIISHSATTPEKPVFKVITETGEEIRSIRYQQLLNAVIKIHDLLTPREQPLNAPRYGIVMANSPEWVACDVALGLSGRIEVPVPTIFNAEQARNLIATVDAVLVDEAGAATLALWEESWGNTTPLEKIYIHQQDIFAETADPVSMAHLQQVMDPAWPLTPECKVIHTSGTTNNPKGVRISADALNNQIHSLRNHMGERQFQHYVSIVPMSLLIEQITGIYLFLSYGGCLTFLAPETPLLGYSNANPDDFIKYFGFASPDFIVVSPSIVERIHARSQQQDLSGTQLYNTLFNTDEPPFIACGNAPIAPEILRDLDRRGLTIYEGYGLSENTSVVTWNSVDNYRFGTVGRPLDHVTIKLADDNELLVKSRSMYLGYTRTDPSSCPIDEQGWLHTGDIAAIDDDGYVSIKGRKKHVLITSNGRNVSPEWVESQYKRLPFVRNMAAFGNNLPYLVGAFLVDADGQSIDDLEQAIVDFGNRHCGDIERLRRFVLIEATEANSRHFLTITGDPMRDRLWQQFLQRHPLASLVDEITPELATA